MARNHFKRKKDKPLQVALEAKSEPKQVSRGESIRPAKHGGYTHAFNYYEYMIPSKEGAR